LPGNLGGGLADQGQIGTGVHMKKIVLAAAAVLVAGSASAADMAVKYKAPPPVPVYNWTGCYVAVGGGYKMWNIEHNALDPALALANFEGTSGGRGWLATGQIGCDYQVASNWLVGVFADVDWTNAKGDYNERFSPLAISQIGELKERWSWSVGGRLGYLVMPRLLTFVSAGYTEARFDTVNFVQAAAGFAPPLGTSTGLTIGSRTFQGWFVGGGTEYGLDWWPGLFWKNEGRFASYDTRTDPLVCTSAAPGVCAPAGAFVGYDRARLYQQSYRSELVWRFNYGGVVAKY
jgi:outer membrane immunogenic protein